MTRSIRMAAGMACVLATLGATRAGAQSWSPGDARRMHNFVEYGVPDPGLVPNAYYVNPGVALPPNAYARRATPGGLIETAARRINPFAAPSRAWDVAFAPAPYRQAAPPPAYRVMRPAYGAGGVYHSPGGPAGVAAPAGGHVPGVNCPTCPRR